MPFHTPGPAEHLSNVQVSGAESGLAAAGWASANGTAAASAAIGRPRGRDGAASFGFPSSMCRPVGGGQLGRQVGGGDGGGGGGGGAVKRGGLEQKKFKGGAPGGPKKKKGGAGAWPPPTPV